jgi:hypothetical protein
MQEVNISVKMTLFNSLRLGFQKALMNLNLCVYAVPLLMINVKLELLAKSWIYLLIGLFLNNGFLRCANNVANDRKIQITEYIEGMYDRRLINLEFILGPINGILFLITVFGLSRFIDKNYLLDVSLVIFFSFLLPFWYPSLFIILLNPMKSFVAIKESIKFVKKKYFQIFVLLNLIGIIFLLFDLIYKVLQPFSFIGIFLLGLSIIVFSYILSSVTLAMFLFVKDNYQNMSKINVSN